MKCYSKILALTFMLSSSGLFAEESSSSYLSIAYHRGGFNEVGSLEFAPSAVQLGLGRYLNEHISVEGNLAKGLISDEKIIAGNRFELDLGRYTSIFLKAEVPTSGKLGMYGKVGFTDIELVARSPSGSNSDSEQGASFLWGFDCLLGGDRIFMEFGSLIFVSAYEYSALNIGYLKKF